MRQYILNALFLMAFPTLMQAQVLKLYYRMDAKIFQPTEVKEISGIDSITLAKDRNGRLNNYFYAKGVEGTATTYGSFEEVGSMRVVSVTDQRTIWDALTEAGNYTYFQRMIDDYDKLQPAAEGQRSMREMLSGWNDREVYAANDAAWEVFFAENAKLPEGHPWHNATSYDRLSDAQKMMLAASSNTPSYGESEARSYAKSLFLRNNALFSPTENVIQIQESDMPHSYSTTEKDYWARFRTENGGKGHILLGDFESPMTTIITKEWCQKNAVREGDFAIITGNKQSDLSKMNNAKVVNELETDNGAVNSVSRPIVPLANMAEVIRTNGRTNIFSHILDRFSAPFYSPELTLAYRNTHNATDGETEDSVFVKRYFSNNSYGHSPLNMEPAEDGTLINYNPYKEESMGMAPLLKFDPAWNAFYGEVSPNKDMAAMFVPSDKALWRFFTKGSGLQFIKLYTNAPETFNNIEELYQCIDQIPIATMHPFVNTIMQQSLTASLPSKMTRLTDEAMEQIFASDDMEKIDTCLLACNGAVYVMDDVYGPADYLTVVAPAFINTQNRIIKWAIYDGQYSSDYMKTYYYTYLKAPQTNFTFFLPSDEAMQYCYDPTSFESTTRRLIQFGYKNQAFPITSKCINYDPATGTIGRAITGQGSSISTGENSETTNRLKDILDSHIIYNKDIHSRNEFFETIGGNIVKVERDENGEIKKVFGGFQLENKRQGIISEAPGVEACNVGDAFEGLKNGQTYVIDAPITPTYRSLYSVLSYNGERPYMSEQDWYAKNPYARFFELCQTVDWCITQCGLVDDNLASATRKKMLQKYIIFAQDNGLDYNATFLHGNFTAYIPTNEAVEAAIANGLPTWTEIEEDCNKLSSYEDSLRVQEKILRLTDFVKGHFIYGQAVADKEPFEAEYVQPMIDRMTGVAPELRVRGLGQNDMSVTDRYGQTRHVTGERNILVRDIQCSNSPVGASMSTSSKKTMLNRAQAGVIHQIDGVLNFN